MTIENSKEASRSASRLARVDSSQCQLLSRVLIHLLTSDGQKLTLTRNAWQSLAYSQLGAVLSPPSKYL